MRRHIQAVRKLIRDQVFKVNGEAVTHNLEVCKKGAYLFQSKVCDEMFKTFANRYGHYNDMDPIECFEELKAGLSNNNLITNLAFENSYFRFDLKPNFMADYINTSLGLEVCDSNWLNYGSTKRDRMSVLQLYEGSLSSENLSAAHTLFLSQHKKLGSVQYKVKCQQNNCVELPKLESLIDMLNSLGSRKIMSVERDKIIFNEISAPVKCNELFTAFVSSLCGIDRNVFKHDKNMQIFILYPFHLSKEAFYYERLLSPIYDSVMRVPFVAKKEDNNDCIKITPSDMIKRLMLECEANKRNIQFESALGPEMIEIETSLYHILQKASAAGVESVNWSVSVEDIEKAPQFFKYLVRHLASFDIFIFEGSTKALEDSLTFLLASIDSLSNLQDKDMHPKLEHVLLRYIRTTYRPNPSINDQLTPESTS